AAGELVEAIAEGRPGVARETAMADREITRPRTVDGAVLAGVAAPAGAAERVAVLFGVALHEAAHLAAVDRVMHRLVAVRRLGGEKLFLLAQQVGEGCG